MEELWFAKQVATKKKFYQLLKNFLKIVTAGRTALNYNTQTRLFMQLNEEKINISLDLKSPILNVKMPNNTSWLNLQEIKNDFVDRKINQLILSFNNQIPWNEKFSTFIIDGSL